MQHLAGMLGKLTAVALSTLLVAACAGSSLPKLPKISDLNPWAEKQQPLPGKREPVLQTGNTTALAGGELAAANKPIVLPPPTANDGWTQPGGVATNAPGHLVLSGAVKRSWSADAGTGSSKSGRVTASPIVYGGRVYTLDAAGHVTAFSASGGSSVWKVSLLPEQEKSTGGSLFSLSALGGGSNGGGYGGGLAADNGRIFAASGFGNVVALDPGSGKKLWEQSLGTPIRAAPTAAGDRVFVVTIDGRFHCLSGLDGTILWVARGLPQQASLVMNVSPAVDGGIVVVPYPSGDLMALKVADGSPVWTENLSRTRATSQMAALSDAARPAIANGTVFAVGHAGRMIATQASTGERLWTLNVPGTQTPWVVGDSVFVVDVSGQLLAITRADGKIQWTTKLPGNAKWSGPTLAGGTLWLASSEGQLVGVDAVTGRIKGQQDIGTPVYVAPVVAQGRMYLLTDKANLLAMN